MTRPDDKTTPFILTASAIPTLDAQSFSGDEALNGLGKITLLGQRTTPLSLDGIVATSTTATLQNDEQRRPLDRLVAEISQLPADATADHYQLVLRPWLWWLTLASNNRVFQNKTAGDIVTAIFDAHGFSDYQLKLTGSYEPREYCVQYGETDFAFVSRLLEEEGIFWFFTHEVGKHTLVLADSNDAFPPIPNGPTVPYRGQVIGGRELHGVRSGQLCRQAVAGGYTTTDYAFTTPGTQLFSKAEAVSGPRTMYEHPGGYSSKARGDGLGKMRVDALRTQEVRFVGESDCRWLVPGHWFRLSGHDDETMNIDWVLTRVTHDASHDHYRNQFEAIPRSASYRPPRETPKPRMHPQVAKVVGKAGEEIFTDSYGRIKIQFPWDRDGQNDESSSCWVRVVLPWTGNGFGMQFIPRIGQEVIVTFIDGDPDRPLVTGCVYNGENALPYALPANQTQSGIKTRSSKQGTGFNELRFDDRKDSEEVFLQAQKDMKVNVLHDATANIGHDETLTVQNSRSRTVKEGDETVTLEKGKRTVNIRIGSDTLEVKDARTVKVGGEETHRTGGNWSQAVSGNYSLEVNGNLSIKVSGTLTLQSSGNLTAKSDQNLTTQAGLALTDKAGTMLTNEAGISLTSKASASQTVDGGGMLTIKGGVVMVN